VRQGSVRRGRKRGEVPRTKEVAGGSGAGFPGDVGERRAL
jgi:hypothetical protein